MNIDLGRINVLGTDAVGLPGQRRFRLFVESVRGSAIMWMEKEHLNSLSMVLDRSLAVISDGEVLRTEAKAGEPARASGIPEDFPAHPTYEIQVGQMKLTYDEEDSMFLLSVTPLEIIVERGQEPQVYMHEKDSITFIFTQEDAQELSSSISQVVASGRPVCPLCHTPLDGGPHACVKQNGHREILQVEEGEDEEE